MRKRWQISDGFLVALGWIWGLGWLPIYLAIAATTTACDRQGCGLNSNVGGWQPYLIFLASWFGVVLVPAAAVGLACCVALLWEERPRRVIEPVQQDLRENPAERQT